MWRVNLLFCIFAVALAAPQVILVESARLNQRKASNELDVTNPVVSLRELVAGSTLIVLGRIHGASTRLLESHDFVITEWSVIPMKIYKGHLAPLTRPGPSTPVVVRQLGGTMVVGDLELTTKVSDWPVAESLRMGEEVVFFLVPSDGRPDAFSIAGGPFGVFRLRNGWVQAATESAAQRREDKPHWLFRDFEREMQQLLDSLPAR